jgi:hypothetical protein
MSDDYWQSKGQRAHAEKWGHKAPKGSQMEKRELIVKMIYAYFAAFTKRPTEIELKTWVESLVKYPVEDIKSVINYFAKDQTVEYMPKLNKLRGKLDEWTPKKPKKKDNKKLMVMPVSEYWKKFGPSDPIKMQQKIDSLKPEDFQSKPLK